VIAERVDRNPTHFGIFTSQIVLGDVSLNFIAHRLIDCHLARDCSTTSRFRTTTSFKDCATVTRRNLTHRSRTLTPRQGTAQLSLHRLNRIRLLACYECSLSSHVTRRHSSAAAVTRSARNLTPSTS
jgi:hypothetical protein